jgi:hypothetical protein
MKNMKSMMAGIAPSKNPSFMGNANPAAKPSRLSALAGRGMGGRAFKEGGVSETKMGKVKTTSKPDGVIKKGATKGKMIKMAGAKKMRGGGKC